MKSLFSSSSLKILESLAFTRTLYAFDFDGTLSKIVPVPSDASIEPETAHLLEELSKIVPVAIVSGRGVQDLQSRLPFTPQYMVGNHGLEGLGPRAGALEKAEANCRSWIAELNSSFREGKLEPGVEIEDKAYSLAVHYRKCRAKKEAKARILQIVDRLDPKPRIILGKCVVNVLPPGAPHKGVALTELMSLAKVRSAFYIGDDDTDEDVFSLGDSRIFTVRVGQRRSSQARYSIRDQSDINRVLRTLIRFHDPSALPPEKKVAPHECV